MNLHVVGFPVSLTDPHVQNYAAMARFRLQSDNIISDLLTRITTTDTSDDSLLVPPFPDWHDELLIIQLDRALHFVNTEMATTLSQQPKVQAMITKHFRHRIKMDQYTDLFATRLGIVAQRAQCPLNIKSVAEALSRTLSEAASALPTQMLPPLFKWACNAWQLSGRSGGTFLCPM